MSNTMVALLRGINVGGRNRMAMADVRRALTDVGLADVRTYIQSGNIVFGSDDTDEAALAATISTAIERTTEIAVPVVVRPLADIERVSRSHPDAGGAVPPKWLHVFLLDAEPSAADAPDVDRFEPDRWQLGEREVYVTYPEGAAGSKLTIGVIERSFGVSATARNLATLQAILALAASDR